MGFNKSRVDSVVLSLRGSTNIEVEPESRGMVTENSKDELGGVFLSQSNSVITSCSVLKTQFFINLTSFRSRKLLTIK